MPSNWKYSSSVTLVVIIFITNTFLSCSLRSKTEALQKLTVKKSNFVHSITVLGYLEASRMITLPCPIQGQDLRITDMVLEGSFVRKGDTLCRLQCSELENQYKDALKNYDIEKSNYDKVFSQQDMESKVLESQIKTIEASVNISMLDSTRQQFYTPALQKITNLKIKKSLIEKDKILNKKEFAKRINTSILNTCQLKIQQQDNAAKRAKAQLDKLFLVADTCGIIEYANLWSSGNKAKIGDVVWDRMPILKLTDISELQVKMLVSENQFKLIQKDQKIKFTIDIIANKSFEGKVLSKLPQGRPVMENSSVKYFEVIASIKSSLNNVPPGVNVNCRIYLDSIQNTITVPIISVFDRDSNKIVYLLEKNKIKQQVVKTGQSDEKVTVITSGLKPNNQILLSRPPDNLLQ